MAGWESSFPPRASSKVPGICVNVEFGVSFAQGDRAHVAGLRFGTRNMQDKVQRRREEKFQEQRLRRQQQDELFFESTPISLMPANGFYMQGRQRNQEEERPQRLAVRTQYERGSSAPPTLSDRHIPLSPIGTISPLVPMSPRPPGSPIISPVSPISIQHVSSMPLPQYDGPFFPVQRPTPVQRSLPPQRLPSQQRPLPPVPSRFRLGEDGLPWSTEPFYRPQSPETAPGNVRASMVDIGLDNPRGEDPQRVRELESLQQAMMTVDSLPNDGWEPWTWDSVGDIPRGPRSIGWAVRSGENTRSTPISPPPPYAFSQWEDPYDRYCHAGLFRPRSSG